MQSIQTIDLQQQIEEASKKAKPKKALYLYDETGNRELLGVFSHKKAEQIKRYLKNKDMINRLTEFEVRTTEPDSEFDF
ncbi:MAG: hypothetical protein MUP98_19870 [Candidatus Aminicenantes bacterium]|nr:hypothetical protein [Candidatus Aminicenantes bacterium]